MWISQLIAACITGDIDAVFFCSNFKHFHTYARMHQVGGSDTKAELLPHRLGRTEDDDPPLYIEARSSYQFAFRRGRCAANEGSSPRARLLADVCGGFPAGLALGFVGAATFLRAFGAS